MSNLKLVIFDFDGTIADTMALGLGIANLLAKKYGSERLQKRN